MTYRHTQVGWVLILILGGITALLAVLALSSGGIRDGRHAPELPFRVQGHADLTLMGDRRLLIGTDEPGALALDAAIRKSGAGGS